MRGAKIRQKLGRGEAVVNAMIPFYAPALLELLGSTGVDMAMLDAEHGALDAAQCEDMVRAADAVGLPAIVRVPHNDAPTILRYLDMGASGIIAPHVTTAEDARRAVQSARYGPLGGRSYGGPRALIVHGGTPAEYVERANREILVIGLFEDVAGIERIDEVFAVEGLDALAIGPSDLAFSMGLGPSPWDARVQEVADRVIAASRRAGKPTGLPASDPEQARGHVSRGVQIISVGVGSLLTGAARQMAMALAQSTR
ncbi:MAG TPA: aldolase/citrate lyase family protein [Chloroflexota bacterium]|jgi:4-hydroxy-2-oxoheptanedioate aldolase